MITQVTDPETGLPMMVAVSDGKIYISRCLDCHWSSSCDKPARLWVESFSGPLPEGFKSPECRRCKSENTSWEKICD
jgi:hypothetical protein